MDFLLVILNILTIAILSTVSLGITFFIYAVLLKDSELLGTYKEVYYLLKSTLMDKYQSKKVKEYALRRFFEIFEVKENSHILTLVGFKKLYPLHITDMMQLNISQHREEKEYTYSLSTKPRYSQIYNLVTELRANKELHKIHGFSMTSNDFYQIMKEDFLEEEDKMFSIKEHRHYSFTQYVKGISVIQDIVSPKPIRALKPVKAVFEPSILSKPKQKEIYENWGSKTYQGVIGMSHCLCV